MVAKIQREGKCYSSRNKECLLLCKSPPALRILYTSISHNMMTTCPLLGAVNAPTHQAMDVCCGSAKTFAADP